MALREIPHPEELYVDEFRDPKKADRLLREIRTLVDKIPVCRVRPLQIMEVCGGHTHAIFKWGLKDYCRTASSWCMAWLSGLRAADGAGRRSRRIGRAPERDPGDLWRCDPSARLTQKPVAGQGGRDRRAHRLFAARRVDDRARPPGQGGRLLRPRLRNDDAEHGLDGIAGRARGHPQFLAVVQSHHNHCDDQSDPRLARADIGRVSRAGHVSMVIGTAPYRFIAEHYKKPIVVAGFEPLDILQSIAMVLRQLAEERCVVENQYRRIVPETGNGPGLKIADPKACQDGEVLKA
jgi:hydrogenase expression/formation protein HypD